MREGFDPSKFTMVIDWYCVDDRQLCPNYRLDELDLVLALAPDCTPASIDSNCPSIADLLEYLAPLSALGDPEMVINGHEALPGVGIDGSPHWILSYGDRVLYSGSAGWEPLPGAPVEFNQYESLEAIEDYYWVNCSGDSTVHRCFVGRFPNDEAAIPLLVEHSEFHYFDEAGVVQCELDQFDDPS